MKSLPNMVKFMTMGRDYENISCLINKQEMPLPSVISGLQLWMRAPKTWIQGMLPLPVVTAEKLEGMQEKRWTRKRDWPQIAEVHMKGMTLVSTEDCIFPYIEREIP